MGAHVDPPKSNVSENYILTNFYLWYKISGLLTHTYLGRGPPTIFIQ